MRELSRASKVCELAAATFHEYVRRLKVPMKGAFPVQIFQAMKHLECYVQHSLLVKLLFQNASFRQKTRKAFVRELCKNIAVFFIFLVIYTAHEIFVSLRLHELDFFLSCFSLGFQIVFIRSNLFYSEFLAVGLSYALEDFTLRALTN